MYSSSSSSTSSSQQQPSSSSTQNPNLIHYDSAPTSFLTNMVDSVVGVTHNNQHNHQQHHHHQFFTVPSNTNDSSTSRSTLSLLHQGSYHNSPHSSTSNNNNTHHHHHGNNGMDSSSSKTTPSPNLIRHSSSPAGLLSHLASDTGYSRGGGSGKGLDVKYNPQGGSRMVQEQMISRLGSQLSFNRKDHHSLSQISEVNESNNNNNNNNNNNSSERKRSVGSQSHNTTGFSLSAWDDNNDNNFIISTSSSGKRGKAIADDFLQGLNSLDSQQAIALEMASMERLMHVPQDSVPCKIRAKRGFATHPRSIAERERRTRISGKLKKLQELVPNMDKQTSYSDMLDLAVQHIKGLQGQIENLNHELDHCKCGCKPSKQP